MWQIAGKRAVVTGAGSGIGKQIALQLAELGTHLILVDIDSDRLKQTEQECRNYSVLTRTMQQDLCLPEAAEQISDCAEQELDGLDILINNAGLAYYGRFEQMTPQQAEELMQLNLLAPIRLTHACFPMLLRESRSQILNVASMFGLFPSQKSTVYHASKYGLVGFSLSLRIEYARFGVGVSALCPGFVKTQLFENMRRPEGAAPKNPPSWMTTTPEHVARKGIRAIRKNKRLVTVTATAKIGDWCQRFLPQVVDWGYHQERKKNHPLQQEWSQRELEFVTREQFHSLAPSDTTNE